MEANQSTDARQRIYQDLHSDQLSEQEAANASSARRILDIVMDYHRPASVLDVGCGIGTWLKVAQSRGISDIRGIEGSWVDPSKLQVEPHFLQIIDLEKGFDLARRFDLVICLEVAEHVSAGAADHFIASLTRHAPVVLFSAAIPYQGGHHHVRRTKVQPIRCLWSIRMSICIESRWVLRQWRRWVSLQRHSEAAAFSVLMLARMGWWKSSARGDAANLHRR